MTLAGAQSSDVVVLVFAIVGAVVGLTGVASFDPRVRSRLPVAALARGGSLVSVGLIVAGLMIIGIALGGGE